MTSQKLEQVARLTDRASEQRDLLGRLRRTRRMKKLLKKELESDAWRSLAQLERWPLLTVLTWIATREPYRAASAAEPNKTIHSLDALMAWDFFHAGDRDWRGPHLSLSEAWHSELKRKFLEGLSCVAERVDGEQAATAATFPHSESGLDPLFYYITEIDGASVLVNAINPSAPRWWNPTFAAEDVLKLWPSLPERTEPAAQVPSTLGEPRGKQPRVIRYLRAHFPDGVAPPGLEPGKQLLTKIGAWDSTLRILSEDTLQRAIQSYNGELKYEASRRKNPQ